MWRLSRSTGSHRSAGPSLASPDIAPVTPAAERGDYGSVVLTSRLRSAFAHLNSDLPDDVLDDAPRRLTGQAGATLEARNRDFHRMLVTGVTAEYVDPEGRVRGGPVSPCSTSTVQTPTTEVKTGA